MHRAVKLQAKQLQAQRHLVYQQLKLRRLLTVLSGGSISSETASAASSALEGITSKGDVSDAGVLSASGDLAVDAGSDSTKLR